MLHIRPPPPGRSVPPHPLAAAPRCTALCCAVLCSVPELASHQQLPPPKLFLSPAVAAAPAILTFQGERAESCPTHLWQMHVCLPAKKGHTRLLYRMSTDFMGWTNYVPFIQNFWKYIAGQVRGAAYLSCPTPVEMPGSEVTHPSTLRQCHLLTYDAF